ncbi:MAG: inositol monophosphatase family protein [Candidatus Neomarinimicrobiota bacterium]
MKKLPEFSISIALVQNNIPVVGVVYNPISEEMFYAEKNKGAFFKWNENKNL